MNSPQPSSEETLFAAASALPALERDAYLDKACAGDKALRDRISALLRANQAACSFMASPPAADLANALTQAVPSIAPGAAVGDRIGRYKLLQKIGEGGCGIVYMAEQEEPVRRRVALKVIKLGMDTKEVIARFEAERQALALMDHANIARVFDAGATDTGRPFFVMELVRGVPITKFCDEQNLPTAARLELFTQVCHAVQHAHQKGIIHRDIKPSNILVTLHDGVAVPKVIDFGIAKATQGRLTDTTLFTAFEQFIGTPAYMSPEQAEMSGLDIDTRSDIYSLGVLLYELLTGRPPFDPKTLVAAGLDEIRRIIREVEPPRPSTCLSTLTDLDRATTAKHHGTVPAQLSTLLRGDLDWIVMRCLEKDRARRYETANGLALDVLRHLHDEPVVARPPSATYRFRKLIRRRRMETVAILLVVALGTAAVGFGFQRQRAKILQQTSQLNALRQEESIILNKLIASPTIGPTEDEVASKCLARLGERIKAGLGSDIDHALLARFLLRKTRLDGNAIQVLDRPTVSVVVQTGERAHVVKGVGIVVRPLLVSVDGIDVGIDGFPVYFTGCCYSHEGRIRVEQSPALTGTRTMACMLEAQLVHAKEASVMMHASAVQLQDYRAIGSPVRIALTPIDRLFLRHLPSEYPLEIIDDTLASGIAADVTVSRATVEIDATLGCTVELELFVPRQDPTWPLAIRVDLVQLGETPVQIEIGSVVGGSTNGFSYSAEVVPPRTKSMSMDSMGFKYPVKFRIPALKDFKYDGAASTAQISFRSSRRVATDSASTHFEHFVVIPETRKTFPITIKQNRDL